MNFNCQRRMIMSMSMSMSMIMSMVVGLIVQVTLLLSISITISSSISSSSHQAFAFAFVLHRQENSITNSIVKNAVVTSTSTTSTSNTSTRRCTRLLFSSPTKASSSKEETRVENNEIEVGDTKGAAILFEDITISRGSNRIMSNVNLRVERNNRWGIVGPNGVGEYFFYLSNLSNLSTILNLSTISTINLIHHSNIHSFIHPLSILHGYAFMHLFIQKYTCFFLIILKYTIIITGKSTLLVSFCLDRINQSINQQNAASYTNIEYNLLCHTF